MHLVAFKIKNYKSFYEETEFSFEALNNDYASDNFFIVRLEDGSEKRLLKTAAIYGANASGKTNLFKALSQLLTFIRLSRGYDVDKQLKFDPFRFGKDDTIQNRKPENTEMELTFIVKDRLYRYKISYNATGFDEERLVHVIGSNDHPVFVNRSGCIEASMEECGFSSEWFCDDNLWAQDYLPTHLFLSEIAVKPQNKLQEIYSELNRTQVRTLGSFIDLKERINNTAGKLLKNNQTELFKKLCKLMRLGDLGITGLEMIEHFESEYTFPDFINEDTKKFIIEKNRWEFKTIHKTRHGDAVYNITEESSGTQNLFSLGALIFDFLENGGVLVYDEIDMMMHPHLFLILVVHFHVPSLNPKNAQLLFTTHGTIIVNETEGVMRSDQIWFIQKNDFGESELYSAQDFEEVGIKVPFERWYRDGRFGGIPSLEKLMSSPVVLRKDGHEI